MPKRNASTLLKPHEPTLEPKLCQRACKANAPREIVLKNLLTLKKIKPLKHESTKKKESKMTMTRKLNNDNGLQDWRTEHQAVTRYIKHLAESANFKGSTINKLCNGLIGNCFEMPNVSYTHPLGDKNLIS